MLLEICVAGLLCTLGVWVIATVARAAMRRLGIEPVSALLWLGLAERPMAPRPTWRLHELLAESPTTASR